MRSEWTDWQTQGHAAYCARPFKWFHDKNNKIEKKYSVPIDSVPLERHQ